MRRRVYATIAVVLFIILTAELVELHERFKNISGRVNMLDERVKRIEHHLESLGHPASRPHEEAP